VQKRTWRSIKRKNERIKAVEKINLEDCLIRATD
jgi:hypothetical protein